LRKDRVPGIRYAGFRLIPDSPRTNFSAHGIGRLAIFAAIRRYEVVAIVSDSMCCGRVRKQPDRNHFPVYLYLYRAARCRRAFTALDHGLTCRPHI
jgi:hypothetical protein